MSKRVILVILMAAALVGAGGATAIVLAGSDEPAVRPDCVAEQERADATVHTGAFPAGDRLAALGRYESIQWQVRTPGACAEPPVTTGRQYQAVVKLRPADTRALVAKYDWLAADAFDYDGMWPGLVPLVPAGVKWNTSWQLDDILLDPQKNVAYAFVTG